MKNIIMNLSFCFFIYNASAQNWALELAINPLSQLNVQDRYSDNTGINDGAIYKEFRIAKLLTQHWNVVGFVGHQRRSYMLSKKIQVGSGSTISSIGLIRNLIPIGCMAQYQNEKWINQFFKCKKNKWQLRSQTGIYTICSKNIINLDLPTSDYQELNPFDKTGRLLWLATGSIGYKLTAKLQLIAESGFGALSFNSLNLKYSL